MQRAKRECAVESAEWLMLTCQWMDGTRVYELDYEGKASGKHNRVCALRMDQVSFAKFECLGEIFICREPPAPLWRYKSISLE